jgi:poly-gamma-glutamate capsule biosynthesis protein CapA/YwtB (metallophosphatase superfamily)
MDGLLTLLAVGDVVVNREQPMSLFGDGPGSVSEILRQGDITFGNCETPYAEPELWAKVPHARFALGSHPTNSAVLHHSAGFDVMSFANNHHMDQGERAFLRTIELLEGEGIRVCGAGRNLEEARRPAIIEQGGVRVAFLAYSSTLPAGYEAGENKAGAAPIRALTHYEQDDYQPGTPPHIHTFANQDDLSRMVSDIQNVRGDADIVVFTAHWGVHWVRALIADYEREVARAAIDAGADLVLGHHAHVLKGIDFYKGRPIFHSMGNFAMDLPRLDQSPQTTPILLKLFKKYPHIRFDPSYPSYPIYDARMTMIVKISIDPKQGKITRCAFRPCYILPNSVPIPVEPGDPRFDEVVTYVGQITEEAGLNATFAIEGNEVEVKVKP